MANRIHSGVHGYGHIADPVGHKVSGYHLIASVGIIPNTFSLEQYAPKVMNQNNSSSCVGHANSGAIVTAFASAGKPLSFVPSPVGIYTLARCIDRVPGSNGLLPKLTDEGSMPNQAVRGLTEWGISPMKSRTDLYSDADPTTINDEPDLLSLETDSATKIIGYYAITSTGAQRIKDIKNAISSGFPITFATQVDNAFEAYNGTDPITAPDPSNILGGHYLYGLAYRTLNSKTILRFRNSWGNWGQNGDAEADEAFIDGLSDIYVMSIKGV
jgi:hypothetical protein